MDISDTYGQKRYTLPWKLWLQRQYSLFDVIFLWVVGLQIVMAKGFTPSSLKLYQSILDAEILSTKTPGKLSLCTYTIEMLENW